MSAIPSPTRLVRLIGVGAGDPGHLTLAAVDALRATDVVFLVDKGPSAPALRDARLALCRSVLGEEGPWRVVEAALPGVGDRGDGPYEGAIAAWRAARVAAYGELVRSLAPGEAGALLVWGDPSLFDGTQEILHEVRAAGADLSVEVVPGISAPAALAARFAVPLNRQGEAVAITSGRRLVGDGWPSGVSSVVVMLDTHDALDAQDDDLLVWWGAYLGLPGERLVSGRLGDVRAAIEAGRTAGRAEHGWLFDTYLLRRP